MSASQTPANIQAQIAPLLSAAPAIFTVLAIRAIALLARTGERL